MATEGGPGTSRKFKAFDIYKNPKNLEIAPVEDYVEECRRQRRYQQAEREKRMRAKGSDRHPDWSPYFRSSYEGADQSKRKNLVCGELIPQKLRQYPVNFTQPFDGGAGRAAADKKAQDDKQGVPDWSPYFRGYDNPMQRRRPVSAAQAALKCYTREQLSPSKMTERTYKKGEKLLVNTSARSSGEAPPFSRDFPNDLDDSKAEKMCYNKTRVFDPSIPMKAKGHMFETTKQEQMRQEHYFMTERAKRPFSSKPRQPFQAGGSYKPRWAGGAFEEHIGAMDLDGDGVITAAEMAEFEKREARRKASYRD